MYQTVITYKVIYITQEYEQFGVCPDPEGNPDTWEVYNSNPSTGGVFDPDVIGMPEWFNRGYTGHEHLPQFDLVNMNGRFYDPIVGRMLSADNYVQEPGYSQSYNRYAYAFNNPLKYTDPSGEIGILAIVGAAVGMAVASYFINAGRNDWEWNPSKWNEGAVTFGANYNPTTGSTSLYGGGMIGNAGFTGGGNLQTGNWGGGFNPFGQAGYNEMTPMAAGTGSINWSRVDGYRGYNHSYYDFGGHGISGSGIIEGDLIASSEGGFSFYEFPSPKEIMAKYPDPSKAYYDGGRMECAVRMSIALHLNGVDISGSNEFRTTVTRNEIVYQPSAKGLADWIETQIGRPEVYIHESGRFQRMDFISKEGIIYFVHPRYGGNNSGHIDVISGGNIGSGFYPNRLIKFWEYSNGSYGN